MKKRKIGRYIFLCLLGLFAYYAYLVITHGQYQLAPGQSVQIKITPHYERRPLDYSSELHIESQGDGALLKLTGRKNWTEEVVNENETYYYYYKEGIILKSGASDVQSHTVNEGYSGTTMDREGIIVPVKKERLYWVSDNKNYKITITNVSDKVVRFKVDVVNR